MNKNPFLVFPALMVGSLLMILVVTSVFLNQNLPTSLNLTASLSQPAPPLCPFEEGFTPFKITATSSLALKQESLLLKAFLDKVENCKEEYNLNTCLALFQEYCVSQGKCTTHYSFSQPATITPEIKKLLCEEWNKRYLLLYEDNNWRYLTELFKTKNISLPSFLLDNYNSYVAWKQSQQISSTTSSTRSTQISNKVVEEEAEEKEIFVGQFAKGEKIEIKAPDIKTAPVSLNPDTNITNTDFTYRTLNLPHNTLTIQDAHNFTMSNPKVDIYQTKEGIYLGNWFVTDAPRGLITVKILDVNGKEIYSKNLMNQGEGVLFDDFELQNLNPNSKYTFVIAGQDQRFGSKEGRYTFDSSVLTKGGAIVSSSVVTQYTDSFNSYLRYLNGAVSPDGKTLSLDIELGQLKKAGNTLIENADINEVIIKDKNGNIIKRISRDELRQTGAFGYVPYNIQLDLSQGFQGLNIEILDSRGVPLEAFDLGLENGLVKLTKTLNGASGWGSVYDPRITYSLTGNDQGYNLSIHALAFGAGNIKIVDAATGDEIANYKAGDVYIAGSSNKYKPGQAYYIIYYDQLGNITKTQMFAVNISGSRANLEIKDTNTRPTLNRGCHGEYFIHTEGEVESIIINGKTYTFEEAKAQGIFDPVTFEGYYDVTKTLILDMKFNNSLQTITLVYKDNLGVSQTVTYKVNGSDIALESGTNNLPILTPPNDEIVGKPVELKNGAILTYYKNDQAGKYYIKADNYKDLDISDIHFGYAPYDNNPQYKQEIIKKFKETGLLPTGAMITFKDGTVIDTAGKGGTVGIYGPIRVRIDNTKQKEETKITVDSKTGTITIPLDKLDEAAEELNDNKYYNNPTVQSIVNKLKNDSYCSQHTCGYTVGAYTITYNPFSGKVTVEVNEDLLSKESTTTKATTTKTICDLVCPSGYHISSDCKRCLPGSPTTKGTSATTKNETSTTKNQSPSTTSRQNEECDLVCPSGYHISSDCKRCLPGSPTTTKSTTSTTQENTTTKPPTTTKPKQINIQ